MPLRLPAEIEMSPADISLSGISDGYARVDKTGDRLARHRTLEHLLVATDLTERSDRALQRAVELAAQLGAQLNVLHVIEAGLPRQLAQRRRVEARALVREQLKHLAVAPSADITVNVRTGQPAREITREALELGSAAIILGYHRMAELDDYPISTTSRILRQGELPVLLVSGLPDGPYRRAVVEIALSQSSTLVLGAAYRLAPGARPHFIHVYADDQNPVLAMLGSGESRAARLRRVQHYIQVAFASQHAEAPAFKTAGITIARGPRIDALLRSVRHFGAEILVMELNRTRTSDSHCTMLLDWQLLAGKKWDVLVIPASVGP